MPYLFLANIDPELQLDVLRQMRGRPRLVALDTMNFWIQGKRDALLRVLARSGPGHRSTTARPASWPSEPNLIKAARAIAALGPRTVVVKRGEYGALLCSTTARSSWCRPIRSKRSSIRPGAGDTFAGGFMGYLAAQDRIDAADDAAGRWSTAR